MVKCLRTCKRFNYWVECFQAVGTKLSGPLEEKTDLHHICAVEMSANLVQSCSKCGANVVQMWCKWGKCTFALDLHGGGKCGANVAFTPFAPHLLQLWTRFADICTAQIWCKPIFSLRKTLNLENHDAITVLTLPLGIWYLCYFRWASTAFHVGLYRSKCILILRIGVSIIALPCGRNVLQLIEISMCTICGRVI